MTVGGERQREREREREEEREREREREREERAEQKGRKNYKNILKKKEIGSKGRKKE